MIKTKRDFKVGSSLYQNGKKGVWYCRFKIKGREIRRSTGKLDVKLARDVAWQIFLDESGVSLTDKLPLLRSTYVQLKDLLKLYEDRMPKMGGCATATAKANASTLKRMFGLVYNDAKGESRLDRIDASLVHAYREKRYQAKNKENDTQKTLGTNSDLRLNYSLNSDYRQAKSVFGRHACAMYKDAGIKLPDSIRDFMSVPFLEAMNTRFVPIEKEVDETMRAAAENAIKGIVVEEKKAEEKETVKLTAPDAVAFELARYCGLTAKEIAAVRWSWFETGPDGNIRLGIFYREEADGNFVTKRNKKNGVISLTARRFESWKKALGFSDKKLNDPLFIDPNETLRAANAYIAKFLPNRTKRLHELRKMAGSDILTLTGSISAAAKFLRDDPSTVERYYASDLTDLPTL